MGTPKTITEPSDLLLLRDDLTIDQIEARAGVLYAGTGLRHRALAHYLHFVDSRGLHQAAGYRSATQWAAGRLGMSTREARDLLRAGRKLPELPAINRAFAEGRLWWTKVRELIKVASADHDEKWLEAALRLTTDELALEVRLSKPGQPPRRRDDRKGLPEIRMKVEASVPPDVYAMWEQVQRKARDRAGRQTLCWEALQAAMEAYLALDDDDPDGGPGKGSGNSPYTVIVSDTPNAAQVACVETGDGAVPISAATRDLLRCGNKGRERIPAGLRRRVLSRDKHCCRRCRSRDSLHEHHIVPLAQGGPTDYWNLLTLCRYCHTLVHAGFIAIEGDPKKGLAFADTQGRELDGGAVVPAATYERLTGGDEIVLQLPESGGLVTAATENGTACRAPVPAPVPGELGARMQATTGPLLQDHADLVAAFAALGEGDVLFIDEIHAMPKAVGATTEPGTLTDPLLSRFENHEYLRFYEPDELVELTGRAAWEQVWIDRAAAQPC